MIINCNPYARLYRNYREILNERQDSQGQPANLLKMYLYRPGDRRPRGDYTTNRYNDRIVGGQISAIYTDNDELTDKYFVSLNFNIFFQNKF